MNKPCSHANAHVRVLRNGLVGMAALLSAAVAGASTTNETLVSYAYAPDSDQLLYTEHHEFVRDGEKLLSHQVVYRDPDGAVLAQKALTYPTTPYAPVFRMEDQRNAYVEGAEYTADGYRLFRQRQDENGEKTVSPGPKLVADAGFDNYVRDHLDALLSGETQKFEMAIAGHLRTLRFRVRLIDREPLFGVPAARFRVEPASLLRLIASPIDITYATETGRLLRYAGVTNVKDAEGKSYDARIDFPTNGAPAETETGSP